MAVSKVFIALVLTHTLTLTDSHATALLFVDKARKMALLQVLCFDLSHNTNWREYGSSVRLACIWSASFRVDTRWQGDCRHIS